MRPLLPVVLVCSLAIAACGSTSTKTITSFASAPSSTATPPPPVTTSATGAVYFEGAAGGSAQRPPSLELTADGTLAVESVQWTSWGGAEATGNGNAMYHGCTPNCAQAPTHQALVAIRLFGVRTCSGRQYYSGVSLTLNSGQLLDKQFLQRSWSPC